MILISEHAMYRRKQQSELTVITRANELCSYIMTVTQKSPKQFRFTFTGRLQNASLNVLEYLIRANETPLDRKSPRDYAERVSFQRKAMTELVIIGYIAVMAMEQKCILGKQCEQISGLCYPLPQSSGRLDGERQKEVFRKRRRRSMCRRKDVFGSGGFGGESRKPSGECES